jgi:MotA/TolQ/ExbB proton channel family
MDLATALGLLSGLGVVIGLIMLDGGHFGAYASEHAVVVVFGGATAATMIRFPFSVILHGLPMGLRYAFMMRSVKPQELIEEITQIADVVRKSGPIALENMEISDPFLAQGARYIADGYDREFIRDTMERDRDNFLMHLDEGSKVYRAFGDCAPAWGMVGTPLEARPRHGDGAARHPLRRRDRQPRHPAARRQAAREAGGGGRVALADHRRHPDDPRPEEPDAGARDAGRLPAAQPSRRADGAGRLRWPGGSAAARMAATAGSSPSPT